MDKLKQRLIRMVKRLPRLVRRGTLPAAILGVIALGIILADTAALLDEVKLERDGKEQALAEAVQAKRELEATNQELAQQTEKATTRWKKVVEKTEEAERLAAKAEESSREANAMLIEVSGRDMAFRGQELFRHHPERLNEAVLLGLESLYRVYPSPATAYLHDALAVMPRVFEQVRHKWPARTALFAPDGARLLTVEAGGAVTMWEVDRMRRVWSHKHGSWGEAAAFSVDGATVALVHSNGVLQVRDAVTGTELGRAGEAGRLQSVAFARDAGVVVMAGKSGDIDVYRTNDAGHVRRLETDLEIRAIDISSDGRWLHAVHGLYEGAIWDLEQAAFAVKLAARSVYGAAFSPDGKTLAVATGSDVSLVETSGWKDIGEIDEERFVKQLEFSRDGRLLALAGSLDFVSVWDLSNDTCLFRLNGMGQIEQLEFSPGAEFLGVRTGDGDAVIVDVSRGEISARLVDGDEIWGLDFHPDEQLAVTAGADTGTVIWDLESGPRAGIKNPEEGLLLAKFSAAMDSVAVTADSRPMVVPLGHRGAAEFMEDAAVTSVHGFADNGRVLVTDFDSFAEGWDPDHSAVLWEVAKGDEPRCVQKLLYGEDEVVTAAESAFVLIRDYDDVVHVVDARTGDLKTLAPASEPVARCRLCGPRNLAALLYEDSRRVQILELPGGRAVSQMTLPSAVSKMTFSPDCGTLLTYSKDGPADLWSTESGGRIARVCPKVGPEPARFSPDGSLTLAWNSSQVWVHRVEDGALAAAVYVDSYAHTAAISSDNRYLLVGSDSNGLIAWNLPEAREQKRLPQNEVDSIVFTPDGKALAASSRNGRLSVWQRWPGGAREAMRVEVPEMVRYMEFSPDGRRLAVATLTQGVSIWLWEPEELAFELCSRLTHNLPLSQFEEYSQGRLLYRGCPTLVGKDDQTDIGEWP